MISEEQLAEVERICDEAKAREKWYLLTATGEVVPQLIADVRKLQKDLNGLAHDKTELELKTAQLEKEADWLALKQANCPSEFRIKGCQSDNINDAICTQCWREAARKAVNNV